MTNIFIKWNGGITNFFEKLKGILTEPSKTFDRLKEETLGEAIKYFAVIFVVYALLTVFGSTIAYNLTLGIYALETVVKLWIIGIFIGGTFFHIFVKLVGGRKGVTQTIKALIYSSTPILLVEWTTTFLPLAFGINDRLFAGLIPSFVFFFDMIQTIAIIWFFVLVAKGLRQLHEITTGKAILAVFFLLMLFVVLAILQLILFLGLTGIRH